MWGKVKRQIIGKVSRWPITSFHRSHLIDSYFIHILTPKFEKTFGYGTFFLSDIAWQTLDSPVVPAGVMSLNCLITSDLSEHLACLAKQRIFRLVWISGFFRADSSSWRASLNWKTTSLESQDLDISDFKTSSGRATDFSPFPKKRNTIIECYRLWG